MSFVSATDTKKKVKTRNKNRISKKSEKGQMLKAPPIISSDLHFSVLFCYCQTYVDNIGQKLQKPRFVTLGAYNF